MPTIYDIVQKLKRNARSGAFTARYVTDDRYVARCSAEHRPSGVVLSYQRVTDDAVSVLTGDMAPNAYLLSMAFFDPKRGRRRLPFDPVRALSYLEAFFGSALEHVYFEAPDDEARTFGPFCFWLPCNEDWTPRPTLMSQAMIERAFIPYAELAPQFKAARAAVAEIAGKTNKTRH